MRLQTHRKLTELALSSLECALSSRFVNGLLRGVIEPDIHPDYIIENEIERPFRKHHSKLSQKIARYYIELALYLYSHGRTYRAGRALGRALHYLQDLVLTRYGKLLRKHREVERKIARVNPSGKLYKILRFIVPEYKVVDQAFKVTVTTLRQFLNYVSRDRRLLVLSFVVNLTILTILLALTSLLVLMSIVNGNMTLMFITLSLSVITMCVVRKCLEEIKNVLLVLGVIKPRVRQFRPVIRP